MEECPEIMVLRLNRNDYYYDEQQGGVINTKIKTAVSLEETMVIQKYNYDEIHHITYQLYAIIKHCGDSPIHGHYIAYCKQNDRNNVSS